MPDEGQWQEETGQANGWTPKEDNESVTGVYKETKTEVGEYNSNIHILVGEDGSEIGVWGNVVIDSRFSPKHIGEECRVTFLGRKLKKSKESTPEAERKDRDYYKNYKVEFRKPAFVEEEGDAEVPFE